MSERPRPSRWARWRVDLRLARRQVWRTKGSSLLVMALVALPVTALAGGAVFAESHTATPAQRAELELGRMQSWVAVSNWPDARGQQFVDDPNSWRSTSDDAGASSTRPGPAPTDPSSVIPASAHTLELAMYASAVVKTATGIGTVAAKVGPVWDPGLEGSYKIIDGRAPASDDEAMVTPGLLTRIGAKIGGTVTLPDAGRTFTITGTMRQLGEHPSDEVLYVPAGAGDAVKHGASRWYVRDWQPDYAQLQELNRQGFVAYARDLVIHPPAGAPLVSQDPDAAWRMLVIGGIAAVFCGYLVVLLAGAAFAVSARRQERSLAVATSVGAVRGDTFRIVTLQGTVLGLVGGIAGAALGVGMSAAFMAVVDDDVRGSFWGNWGIRVPWPLVLAVVAFAVVVGTLAAIAPARAASRGDVIGALRGARRPTRLNPRRPLWALGMMIAGLAATAVGAIWIAALNAIAQPDYQDPLRAPLLIAVALGPVIFQIGFIVGGHWTLTMIAKVLSRLGIGPRIAGRDAAANPSRVVPAFAAIAACVFIASLSLTVTNMSTTSNNRQYGWTGHEGTVSVGIWASDPVGHADEDVAAAEALLAPSEPSATVRVDGPAAPPADPKTGEPTDPGFPVWTVAAAAEFAGQDAAMALDGGGGVNAIDPDDLATVFGEPVPADDLAAYRNGAALVVSAWSDFVGAGDTVRLVQWTSSGINAYNNARSTYYAGGAQTQADLPSPEAVHEVPVRVVRLTHPQGSLQTIIAPATAAKFGIRLQPQSIYATYSEPPTDAVVDALTASAENTRLPGDGGLNVMVERGPSPIDPTMWAIVAVTGVLVLGAGAICLGLARFERRPDDGTLTAMGATRRLRRRVNGWQALIVVGIGTVVGTVAGLIPAWAVTQTSGDYLQFADTPWLWLGSIALGLPAVMAAASWLIPPRTSDLTRRTAIA